MSDYIKREDAVEKLEFHISMDLLDDIKDIPSADVVPVVRCKDCIYYQDNNNGYPHNECRWRSDETPDATDFCSFGERKDDEII